MTNERKTIMTIDDNLTVLTTIKEILRNKFEVYTMPSAEIMFNLLERVTPNLILLDIQMPDMNGYEALKILRKNSAYSGIPVIFLTAKTEASSELEGLSLGAIDYITKPFLAPLLIKRIENHLLLQDQKDELQALNNSLTHKTTQILSLQNAILSTIADLVEFRDDITGGHISRTQKYMKLLVDKLLEKGIYADETAKWNLDYLLPFSQLHDVGKIAISELILNKPGRLTADEFEELKKHVEMGTQILNRIALNAEQNEQFMHHAHKIAGSHHEKWDGSGYPAGLKGTAIPLEGRVMAVADVYDALVSHRPYKEPYSTEEAEKIINDGSGTHFDPALVEVFNEVADKFAVIAQNSITLVR